MITVRLASANDLPVLVDLSMRLVLETEGRSADEATATDGFQALLEDNTKGFVYVAEEGQEVLGCCIVTFEWSDWRNGMVWWLQGIYVREERRKQGIFTLMYTHIKDTVDKSSAIKGIRLFVDDRNTVAVKAYSAVGMNADHYRVFQYMK